MILAVTGLYRNKDMFKPLLKEYSDLREKGVIEKIYFSTWKERIASSEITELKDLGVELILESEPTNIGPGSVYAQVKSVSNCLDRIDDGSFVFKTRTDIVVRAGLIEAIHKKYEEGELSAAASTGFSSKIWLNAFEVTKPFYVEDTVYASDCRSLKKLISFDNSFDAAYGKCSIGGETHIRQFIKPFLEKYSIFERYKELLIIGGNFISRDEKELRELLIGSDEYRQMLATYYHILLNYFHVYHDPNLIVHKQSYSNSLSTPFDNESFIGNFVNQRLPNGIIQRWCHQARWLEDVKQGRFNHEAPAKDIQRKMLELENA